jgi:hypothetical protein
MSRLLRNMSQAVFKIGKANMCGRFTNRSGVAGTAKPFIAIVARTPSRPRVFSNFTGAIFFGSFRGRCGRDGPDHHLVSFVLTGTNFRNCPAGHICQSGNRLFYKVYRLAEDGERFQEICIFDCFVCLENRPLQGLNCALWLRGDATGYISLTHPYHAFGIALPRSCYR